MLANTGKADQHIVLEKACVQMATTLATKGDPASSLTMMWENTHIIMDKWKQVLKNFKILPPCHWNDAAITIQHWM
eukprot:13316810-Ditylum_brightwellii.AAC.1